MLKIPLAADAVSVILTPRAGDLGLGWQVALLGLLLLAPVGLVVWLYRFELQLVRRWHARGLLATRLLLLCALWCVVALQPTLSHVALETVPSRVCVAVDVSASMDVADVQRTDAEADALARAFGASRADVAGWTRREIARRVLTGDGHDLLQRLRQRHDVAVVAFHETRWDVEAGTLAELLSAAHTDAPCRATDVRQALVQGDSAAGPLHGIIVLTDGRHNHGETPIALARQLGTLGIPIYPVALGSERPPPDLLVAEIQAPDKAFKDTTLPVTVRVKATHLPAQALTVELDWPVAAPDLDRVRKLKHAGGDATYEVSFQVPLKQAGTYTLSVRATAEHGGEITLANNQRSHVVYVAEDRTRVLLVDEEARWEYHYLAGALQRDATVRLERVLFAPPRLGLIKPEESDRAGLPRTRLPEAPADRSTPDPLLDYDCIILGDVAPEKLPAADRLRLQRYVAERGGTLILVAGKRAVPLAYTGAPADDPLLKMLPIREPRVFERKEGFTLQLTAAGKQAPFLRLDAEAGGWPDLPKHFWGIVGTRQPGATVLAMPANEAPDEQSGLIVQQTYGFGKVVFVGLDSTWRWRYRVGDTYHHRFWGQIVRWAAADRLLPAGNRLVRFGSRAPVYRAGQPIELAARLTEKAPPLQHAAQARVFRLEPAGNAKLIALVPLQAHPQQRKLLEGQLRDLPAGTYRMELDGAELQSPDGKMPAATFTVIPEENRELLDLSTDWELLHALAQQSHGRVFTPADAEQVLDLLAQKVQPRESRQDSKAWQDEPLVWWLLGTLLGLLTAEWLWRKRLDLP